MHVTGNPKNRKFKKMEIFVFLTHELFPDINNLGLMRLT